MNRFTFLIIFLFFFTIQSKAEYKVTGYIKNASDNTIVTIVSYGINQSIVNESRIINNTYEAIISKQFPEGIYTCRIHEFGKYNKMIEFDFIINYGEKECSFIIDFEKDSFPQFSNSLVNKNWYEFIKVQNFRLEVMKYLEAESSVIKSSVVPTNNKSNILDIEKRELLALQKEFISNNYCKWSTYAIKYDVNRPMLLNLNEKSYWKHFDTSNKEIIHTPLYQRLIFQYILGFYNKTKAENYKHAFNKIELVFSSNELTRKWVLNYINSELIDLISPN